MSVKRILAAVLVMLLAVSLCACGTKSADEDTAAGAYIYAEQKQQLEALIAQDADTSIEDSAEREIALAASFEAVASALAPIGEYAPTDKDEKASSLCHKAGYYQASCLQKAASLTDDPALKRDCLQKAIDVSSELGSYGLSATKKASKICKNCSAEYADILFETGEDYESAAQYYTIAGNADKANLCRYRIAENHYEAGNFEAAYEEFEAIRSITVTDDETGETVVVKDLLKNDAHLIAVRETKYTPGNIVAFGSYHGQPLNWYILRREGNELLLLSADIIDCKQYSKTWTAVNWEQSSMRLFLNADLLAGFTAEQKGMIITSMANTEIGVGDQAFLLSRDEAAAYCDETTLKAKVSDEAKVMGVWEDDDGFGWWWLRDCLGDRALLIRHDGKAEEGGYYVNYGHAGVRPAIRISIAEE